MGKRLVHGVGINDADYPVCVNGLWCPKYVVWKTMMARAYDAKAKARDVSYECSEVVPEWHLYSTFLAWLETKDWQGLSLDKDLIRQGNTVYGPDACVFVPQFVNAALGTRERSRGPNPLGTWQEKNRQGYRAAVSTPGGRIKLGTFATKKLAHRAWQEAKVEVLLDILARYRGMECYHSGAAGGITRAINQLLSNLDQDKETLDLKGNCRDWIES